MARRNQRSSKQRIIAGLRKTSDRQRPLIVAADRLSWRRLMLRRRLLWLRRNVTKTLMVGLPTNDDAIDVTRCQEELPRPRGGAAGRPLLQSRETFASKSGTPTVDPPGHWSFHVSMAHSRDAAKTNGPQSSRVSRSSRNLELMGARAMASCRSKLALSRQ